MTGAEKIDTPQRTASRGGSCVACGSTQSQVRFSTTDRLYRTTGQTFHIVECGQCGLLRLSPQPGPSDFDRYYPANYWFENKQNTVDSMEQLYRRLVLRDHLRFVAHALRQVREGGPVLDAGCGGGLFLGMLRQRGFQVLGMDISSDAARLAWRQQGVPAVAGELSANPIAPGSCAAVTMFHVLEHVSEPQHYMEQAHSLLRPNGRFVVQVPNAACWQFALLGRAWNGVDAPRHLHLFRAIDVEKMLERSGFEIVRRKYFSLRDNPAGLATSLAPSLDPMSRRIRRVRESGWARLLKNFAYFALVVAAIPFTLLESAFRAGSTVMIEARKRPA
jgi:2-polyprenyl-3-methyl-5-hydroxy-6-metoxy-1,4-benzoquinol methylase